VILSRAGWTAAALLLLGTPELARAQEGRSPKPEEARRLRWQSLSEEDRRAMRARFEEFRRLPQQEQERLRERSRSLGDLRRRVEESLPPDVAERLRALPPRERFEAIREALEEQVGERRDILRQLLPREAMDRLIGLPSPERQRLIRQLLGEQWGRWAERRLSPSEQARVRALPPAERRAELLRLGKERAVADLEAKPDLFGRMSREQWERMKALPPRQFFAQLAFVRAGFRGRPGPPPPPFLAPTPEERKGLESLPLPERRLELERLFREKVRSHLREVVGLPPAEADRIADLPRVQALQELRRVDPLRFPPPPAPPDAGPR
jgi:hypothetical protein